MTPKEVLIAAKALIDTPEKWGKGWSERRRMCVAVALGVVAGNDHRLYGQAHRTLRETSVLGPDVALYHTNDRSTHADVMAWFDRAIEAAS